MIGTKTLFGTEKKLLSAGSSAILSPALPLVSLELFPITKSKTVEIRVFPCPYTIDNYSGKIPEISLHLISSSNCDILTILSA